MADDRKSGYCRECQQNVFAYRKGTNHILHLLICVVFLIFVFPLGILWAFVWLGLSIKAGGWACSNCGSKKIGSRRKKVA